jgi:hypothetical protein
MAQDNNNAPDFCAGGCYCYFLGGEEHGRKGARSIAFTTEQQQQQQQRV